MGILYHWAWALLIIWDGQFPEPQLSNRLKFPRLVFYNGFLLETKGQKQIQLKMKTLRFIGMALFAFLMGVNFASCSSDDDPTEEKEEGGVVVSGKKLVKIVGKSADNSYSETYTFSYDNKGRLIEATESYEGDRNNYTETYQFTWGDNAIKVISTFNDSNSNYTGTDTYTITLKNGLAQNNEDGNSFIYSNSNRIIKCTSNDKYGGGEFSAIWDGDKLVSISEEDQYDATLTYGTSCKKGYFPFVATMLANDADAALFMAHPEIAGMRTNQLPTKKTSTDNYGSEISTLTYEFDKEGYISKIVGEEISNGSTETYTYTLTWQ